MDTQPLYIYKLAKKTNHKKAFTLIKEHFPVQHLGEILFISTPLPTFIFHTGIVISWNNPEVFNFIKKNKRRIFTELLQTSLKDKLSFSASPKFEINEDVIYVDVKNHNLLFVLSYAIAQSLQFELIEQKIAEMFQITKDLPSQLATQGRVKFSSKEIKKIIGQLLQFEHEMSSSFTSVEAPDITWEDPRLEPYYNTLAGYLELKERAEIVEKKFSLLQNTMGILRDESNTHHSTSLEWIIIGLILFETIIVIFEYIVG